MDQILTFLDSKMTKCRLNRIKPIANELEEDTKVLKVPRIKEASRWVHIKKVKPIS